MAIESMSQLEKRRAIASLVIAALEGEKPLERKDIAATMEDTAVGGNELSGVLIRLAACGFLQNEQRPGNKYEWKLTEQTRRQLAEAEARGARDAEVASLSESAYPRTRRLQHVKQKSPASAGSVDMQPHGLLDEADVALFVAAEFSKTSVPDVWKEAVRRVATGEGGYLAMVVRFKSPLDSSPYGVYLAVAKTPEQLGDQPREKELQGIMTEEVLAEIIFALKQREATNVLRGSKGPIPGRVLAVNLGKGINFDEETGQVFLQDDPGGHRTGYLRMMVDMALADRHGDKSSRANDVAREVIAQIREAERT